MTLRIYGAGHAGLLAATMLRRLSPTVHEAQAALPDNHGALLRFRSNTVALATGQPFRQVRVLKAVKSGGRLRGFPTIRDANQYSFKVTGEVMPRSVIDLTPVDRWIAPDDFVAAMAADTSVTTSSPLSHEILQSGPREIPLISTIPMPVLMKMVGWPTMPAFSWRPVWSVVIELTAPRVDLFQTVYYPEPDVPYYRASISGSKIIVEYAVDPGHGDIGISHVIEDFGLLTDGTDWTLHPPKRQEYGKLLPLSDRERQEFILAMTDQYNLYSVGRFAVWRQLLLDDVVQDVRRVERWITQRSAYGRRLESSR